jgi:predicted MFS family arabinose efflux permease
VIDAIMSCIVAVIVYRTIPETKPEPHEHEKAEPFLKTVSGYRFALRDTAFVSFVVANIIMMIVYTQMYSSLSVYLRDNHGINPQGYGFLMTTSAVTVVFFQFWLIRRIKHLPPFLMMALGTIFYMIGFALFGIVTAFFLFALNIVIITIGEMIVVPTSQALVAGFAPEAMRGRYMAVGASGRSLRHCPKCSRLYLDNTTQHFGISVERCAISVFAYYLHLRLGETRPPPRRSSATCSYSRLKTVPL